MSEVCDPQLFKFFYWQKSTGCAAYAIMQHYLWLVVFAWMVVEAVEMYLKLVQVFDAHISHYALKYNLAAWGVLKVLFIILPNKSIANIACYRIWQFQKPFKSLCQMLKQST